MGAVDRRLVEVRLEELHHLALVLDRLVHDVLPGRVAHAARDVRREPRELVLEGAAARHEVHVPARVVGVDEPQHLLHVRLVPLFSDVLHVDVHDRVAGELGEDLLEAQDLQPREVLARLRAEVELQQFLVRVVEYLALAVRDAVERRVVDGDDLAVLRPPEIELDLIRAKRHGRAERGQAVLRRHGAEAAVRAEALGEGLRGVPVSGDDRAAGGTVLPRTPPHLDVGGVETGRVAVAHGLEVLRVRVELHGERAHAAEHVAEHLARRRHDHRAAAHGRVGTHAHRGAHEVRARVVGEELADHLEDRVRVAALVRAADDHVRLEARDVGEVLVEVEVVAREERVAHAVDLENLRLRPLPHVRLVEAEFLPLARREMLLVVLAHARACLVEGEGGVALAGGREVERVHEHGRLAALRRLGAGREERRVVLLRGGDRLLARPHARLAVARLREHDEVEARVALLQRVELPLHGLLDVRHVKRVRRLHHAGLDGAGWRARGRERRGGQGADGNEVCFHAADYTKKRCSMVLWAI